MIALKVTNAFADYGVGDTITGRSEMNEAQASNPASVVRVKLSDEEADAVKAAKDAEAAKAPAPAAAKTPVADAPKSDAKPA